MEAASARMASRDRFGGSFGEPQSTLQRYICEICRRFSGCVLTNFSDNACDPQNLEPNLGLNLEVADLVNSKKGNAYVLCRVRGHFLTMRKRPREAAINIVNFINHRNPNVNLLALAVCRSLPDSTQAYYIQLPQAYYIQLLDICVKNCGYPFHLQI